MALQTGTVIAGRYRLDRLLGEGGMGFVWAATHTVTGGRVALKFVKGAIDTPDMRRRFLREARVATLVDHPNVVQIRDVFDHEETPVLVMDLLQGETLADRLERVGRLELPEAARIAVSVIAAAGAAHEVGLIHRDLKPENVFLARTSAGEVVRVLDFGIAKLVRAPDDPLATAVTQTGALIGTPAYMAPEQLFGEKDLDHRVDVWSIGVMLHEMLTGARPVEGENFGQIAKRLLSAPLPSIASFRNDLPPEVVSLVDRMLVRERAERLADLNEAAAILAPHGAAPKPSFGPPRARPILDSDPDGRIIVSDAADPKAATVHASSGRQRVFDPEASTMVSAPRRSATPAPASPSSSPAESPSSGVPQRLPVDTSDAQVASRTMVSGATTTRSRTRLPVLVGAALVAVAAVVGVVIAAKPGAHDSTTAGGAPSAKAPSSQGAAKHAGTASAAASSAHATETPSPHAPPADAPSADPPPAGTATGSASASAEPATSGQVEPPPATSTAPSSSVAPPKSTGVVSSKAFLAPKPVASASAAPPVTTSAAPTTTATTTTSPTRPPGLVTESPF